MKRILLVLMVLFASSSFAQNIDSYIEILRSDVRTDKVAMITQEMDFTETEASVFWPAYRTYQFDLDVLGDSYIAIVKDYAAHCDSLSGEKATELTMNMIEYKEKRLKLQKKYFKEFSKLVLPIKAARWLQLENQIGLLIELQVISEIPLAQVPATK